VQGVAREPVHNQHLPEHLAPHQQHKSRQHDELVVELDLSH
jgi:hypothetical protein